LEELGVDERKILKGIFKKWNGGVGRLNLTAQDKDRWWWALVNVVMFHIRALGNK
jgi:hypothetical protein